TVHPEEEGKPIRSLRFNITPGMRRLFGHLHLQELILDNVYLEPPLIQKFDELFDDGVTFDKLAIRAQGGLHENPRLHELIVKARKQVVVETGGTRLSNEELLSFERSVKIIIKSDVQRNKIGSLIFIELLCRGHSLNRFGTDFSSEKEIELAVQTVLASSIDQKIYVRALDYLLCDRYVHKVGAKLV
ncbi:hypothetical protein PENTCL1PPCAC_3477, partial [Pristionchus entomophagus]